MVAALRFLPPAACPRYARVSRSLFTCDRSLFTYSGSLWHLRLTHTWHVSGYVGEYVRHGLHANSYGRKGRLFSRNSGKFSSSPCTYEKRLGHWLFENFSQIPESDKDAARLISADMTAIMAKWDGKGAEPVGNMDVLATYVAWMKELPSRRYVGRKNFHTV